MAMVAPSPITRRRWLFSAIGLAVAPVIGYGATVDPKLALLGAALIFVGILFLFRPIWAVYALVIGTSFDSITVSTGFALLGAGDLACLLLLPIWLAHRLLRTHEFRYPHGLWFLVGFLALAFVSLMLGVAPHKAYNTYIRLLVYALAVFAIADLVREADTLERILVLIAVCSFIHAVLGLVLPSSGTHRIGGLVDQPNLLGAKIAFGIFPMTALLLRARHWFSRVFLAVATVVMLVAVGLTISRGTYLGLLAGALFWVRRSPRLMLLTGFVAAAAFFSLTTLAQDRVNRIERRLEFDGSSVVNRSRVVMNSFKAIVKHPVFGVGFGQFSELGSAVDITAEVGRGGHSFYLATAASVGLPALIAFLLFGFAQVRRMKLVRPAGSIPDGLDQPRGSKGVGDKQTSGHARDGPLMKLDVSAFWVVSVFQAILVFHAVSLIVRGSQRLTEWTMFGLYAAAALLIDNIRKEPPS